MTSGSSPEGGASVHTDSEILWFDTIGPDNWDNPLALKAQQQKPIDAWFLGPEGYAAFETSVATEKGDVTAEQVVITAISNPTWRRLSNNSRQLAADNGLYWDF